MITCKIGDNCTTKALIDLRASVNLLPFWMYTELRLTDLKPVNLTLELGNYFVIHPRCIIEDVLVNVFNFYYPVDFIVLDTLSTDNRVPIILGRPFLATAKAHIGCTNGAMTLAFGNLIAEVNVFNFLHQQDDLSVVEDVCMIDGSISYFFDESFPMDPLTSLLDLSTVDFVCHHHLLMIDSCSTFSDLSSPIRSHSVCNTVFKPQLELKQCHLI